MKKRMFLVVAVIAILSVLFVISASAETYYCDKEGNLVDSTSKDIAYEFDLSDNCIPYIYLHDTAVTKIVLPDIESYTGTVKMQSNYDKSLGIYAISDKETKASNLITQITEIEIHESIYLDGAYSVGTFAGYTGLQKISFYNKVGVASKGGFFGSSNTSNITEMHFYGKDIAVPSKLISSLTSTKSVTIVFHEGSSGTLSTGGDTLPTFGSLNNWKIIINENITPSNTSDTRLGTKWGTITATTGWELIVAVNPSLYTPEELEKLKTSHGFCSRAESVDTATVKEATVMSYCDAIYNGAHNENDDANCETDNNCSRCGTIITTAVSHIFKTQIIYADGFTADGKIITDCTNDGCTEGDTEAVAEAVFTCLGYSVGSDGYSLKAGFLVNTDALNEYKALYPSFTFGIVMANADTIASSEAFFVDAELNSNAKGIMISVEGVKYATLNIDVWGFDAEIATSLNLVAGIYTKDAEGKISLIQYIDATKYTTTKTYKDMSLSAITFNQVRVGHGMDALAPQPTATTSSDEE